MKKILVLLLLSFLVKYVPAQKLANATDTVVVNSIEKSYPGGFAAFNKYIKQNVRPPAIAYENRKVGTSYVSFVIEPDGTVSNVLAILAVGSGMDEEAVRVIRLSKNWLPATIDGKMVRSFCRVGVQFLADFEKQSMWIEARPID